LRWRCGKTLEVGAFGGAARRKKTMAARRNALHALCTTRSKSKRPAA